MRAIKENKDNYILILLLTLFSTLIIFIIVIYIYTQNSFRLACINNNGELYVSNWVYFCK
jgi:hypothetical protein